jgi:hypothetical protein
MHAFRRVPDAPPRRTSALYVRVFPLRHVQRGDAAKARRCAPGRLDFRSRNSGIAATGGACPPPVPWSRRQGMWTRAARRGRTGALGGGVARAVARNLAGDSGPAEREGHFKRPRVNARPVGAPSMPEGMSSKAARAGRMGEASGAGAMLGRGFRTNVRTRWKLTCERQRGGLVLRRRRSWMCSATGYPVAG